MGYETTFISGYIPSSNRAKLIRSHKESLNWANARKLPRGEKYITLLLDIISSVKTGPYNTVDRSEMYGDWTRIVLELGITNRQRGIARK